MHVCILYGHLLRPLPSVGTCHHPSSPRGSAHHFFSLFLCLAFTFLFFTCTFKIIFQFFSQSLPRFALSRALPPEGCKTSDPGKTPSGTLTTEYTFTRHIPCVGAMSSKPGSRSAKTPKGRAIKATAAKTGLLPAEAITGTGDNDTSAQSQPPNGDHAMRAADRDPAGGERPMELKAASRLVISRKRGSRKNSLKNTKQPNQGGSLPF